jgi:hypothetical protein
VIKTLIGGVRLLAFEPQRAAGVLTRLRVRWDAGRTVALGRALIALDLLRQVFAVIGLVSELVRWPAIILQLVRVHTLELVVLLILFRTVCSLESEHVEGIFVHCLLQ